MKRIIVTGASSGIGRATAELFAENGWRVGLIARRADALAEIAARHPNAVPLPADVTDPAAMARAFDAFGPLDVLFNNAGIFGQAGSIDEIPLEDWQQVVGVNLHGMFIAARLAFGAMRAQGGGRIINNGSLAAHVPRPGSVSYTTTKHAITGLTRSLSLDGRPYNIACGQIDIGNAETDMIAMLRKGEPQMETMDVAHAAASVLHMAGLPLDANVQFMTVMATRMPFIGRG
ncbi:short-chain dehydrogenase [Sulfitobacter alexandrii]|uniref:Short-chain dehydrogenase n=1 Tax=Sulfitobacter alexandrii TaxID=1917485 RepID=A0A1J0WJF6_9RHOB|nr:SDR family oxidoreductase [Sulfitobacter alexandrii]APE44312.1 short-chain dehydrogenase [Sulfitobacter alexandrii]